MFNWGEGGIKVIQWKNSSTSYRELISSPSACEQDPEWLRPPPGEVSVEKLSTTEDNLLLFSNEVWCSLDRTVK
jgi:hypothetical protein